MAVEASDHEQDESTVVHGQSSNHHVPPEKPPTHEPGSDDDGDDDEEEEEEDEDEEPKLKNIRLTGSLASVYRGGDATSAFMVAGDKMVVGTHNGRVHVLSSPTFTPLRLYPAHSASVTSISVSPYPPPWPTANVPAGTAIAEPPTPSKSPAKTPSKTSSASPQSPKQPAIPITPSNSIFIATSSIDGYVFVTSLVDPKDMMKRNFARPVQAVALSPDFKNDRSFLTGGLAGSLILTSGSRAGVSANANTSSAAAAASGWLGAIGLGSNSGKDTILSSGEGAISTIKWSLSGKFIMWVSEAGIGIMRSNLHLESADQESAWKLIAHIDRPNRKIWEEMSAVWKARAEWVDVDNLESDERDGQSGNGTAAHSIELANTPQNTGDSTVRKRAKKRLETLVVGWGDTTWVIKVKPGGAGTGKHVGEKSVGSADIVKLLRFDDCIISGLSLYTPSLMLVLAYLTRGNKKNPATSSPQTTPRKGAHHRQNGSQPELRLIDLATKDEIDYETLPVSRFEALSAADYHLSTIYVPQAPMVLASQKGALEAIGSGMWDVTVSAGKMLTSGVSILSLANSGDGEKKPPSVGSSSLGTSTLRPRPAPKAHAAAVSVGLKIFIHSPYDCILAVKRDLADHLKWLLDRNQYKEGWELIDEHPEVVTAAPEKPSEESPETPGKKSQSLKDFFADDSTSQTTISVSKSQNSAVAKEKRRIGDLWVQQLVSAGDWTAAGRVAGRVLGTSSRWEEWVLTFTQAGHFDEITPYIPNRQLKPPLPSLVYELVLGHYILYDRLRMSQLLNEWDTDLFDAGAVISALESKLEVGDVREDTVEGGEKGRDWRLLMECLAKLYIADQRSKEALRCYVRLQNADAALSLIRTYHLLGAIADDIPGFMLLRVNKNELEKALLPELEEASSEAVRLLVDNAYQGIVTPAVVVEQLQAKGPLFQPFLFFYLRALWKGEGTGTEPGASATRIADEGKDFVEEFADLAVALFAEYDRPLLMEFLKSSHSYAFDKAAQICEKREYIPELVYLLSKTGQTKRALFLIIDKLADVSLAISFAKEQEDPDLWNDLLDYSMDKPRFIRALLHEVGTAINPLDLVRRIPEGLEIEGLREGILRMVREYEIQHSISEGVAKVLQGEVAAGMDELRAGQNKGLRFEVVKEGHEAGMEIVVEEPTVPGEGQVTIQDDNEEPPKLEKGEEPGYCVVCGKSFALSEKETLLGFACGHVFHLSCLLSRLANTATSVEAERLQAQLAADADTDEDIGRSVGAKVAHAHLIRRLVQGGCPVCKERAAEV